MSAYDYLNPELLQRIDEIAREALGELSDEQKAMVADMTGSDLIGAHFGIGVWIRNRFSLWSSKYRNYWPSPHPDEMSSMILTRMRELLREQSAADQLELMNE